MVVDVKQQVCDGYALKGLITGALYWLEHHQERVNALNVFPVPDGDTGTNMVLTLRKAYEAISDMDDHHAGLVSAALKKGALMGARGNSGVILSQLIRGFADCVYAYEVFDVPLLAQAARQAVATAYDAVIQPAEGTILTVSRRAAEAVERYAESHDDLRDALNVMLEAAHHALQETPELLPVLKKAGVVDSGGQGLVFILEGMTRVLRGEPVQFAEPINQGHEPLQDTLDADDEAGYGYDVQFLMRGQDMDVAEVRAAIDAMGWSTLVVGEPDLIKVHVHVHDPGQPISYAIQYGAALDDVVVENMQAQYEAYMQQSLVREVAGVAVITVARGRGIHALFSEGLEVAYVIPGGQTMNPNTQAFLDAIRALPNKEIVILPNNRNIVMTAQQAAGMIEDKEVRVVPTTTIPQGVNALLATVEMRAAGMLEDVLTVMQDAMSFVTTCEVTSAVRAAHFGEFDIEAGQYIGFVDNQLVVSADTLEQAVVDTLHKAGTDEHELITVYYGDEIHDEQARELVERLSQHFPQQTVDVVNGGQPLYPYIISIE